MKLYREVKASERLPDRDGRYSVKYKKGYGPINNPYDYMYFDPINPQWDEIESWLEPKEITEDEEEIAEVFDSEYGTPSDDYYDIEFDAYMAGYKAALSKLKGE